MQLKNPCICEINVYKKGLFIYHIKLTKQELFNVHCFSIHNILPFFILYGLYVVLSRRTFFKFYIRQCILKITGRKTN